ncbi:MAG: hypothetical protein HQL33_02210 [Alphaproteobacteria bacterium]|nr:hypothetical protein [Alphaproteobacteria bacterium]
MSSSRLFVLGLAVPLLLTGTLAGCGFQPLYGRNAAEYGGTVPDQLAQVRIEPVGDRAGVLLRNHLHDRMAPRGPADVYRYELEITLSNSSQSTILRKDATATRANLTLSASFRLKTLDTKRPVVLVSGSSQSVVSYDILDAQFATVISEKNAQDRAIREISNDIVNRLALYFSHPTIDRATSVPDLP